MTGSRRRIVAAGLALVFGLGVCAGSAAAEQTAAIVDLGTLPGGWVSMANAINDDGVVVGFSDSHAVKWDHRGRITALGAVPGSTGSRAIDINEDGLVVGVAFGSDGRQQTVIWDRGGRPAELGTLPGGSFFSPIAVNDRGSVLGYGDAADRRLHVARWDRGRGFRRLADLEGEDATPPTALNNRGVAVGQSYSSSGGYRALRWDRDGRLTELPSIGPLASVAFDVNDDGVAVGTAWLEGQFSVPVEWDRRGRVTELPTPGGDGRAFSINRNAAVAGRWLDADHRYQPCRWTPDRAFTALDSPPTADITNANQINDDGVTAGHAWYQSEYRTQALRWDAAGTLTELGTLGGPDSQITDLNEHGEAVGYAMTAEFGTHAVLWPAP